MMWQCVIALTETFIIMMVRNGWLIKESERLALAVAEMLSL